MEYITVTSQLIWSLLVIAFWVSLGLATLYAFIQTAINGHKAVISQCEKEIRDLYRR